ncbi:ABC transporter permease subunit [Cohnella sp. CFH 77786]|uniref:carbohydrate ABC transporter permease n=1 Tax=Cohnella sp. CFH 77786 TaxID=2662265 RepID=UPI001C60DDD1|nr:sugar ABC transporter permease [Cohnella sp. CFH 77786]MBW5444810.1 ABC transporter permease subunit [Cohnella sp. CFH 77786]
MGMQHRFSYRNREIAAAWLFTAPSLILLAVFMFYPMLRAFCLSFSDSNLIRPGADFVGLANYARLLEDAPFWHSLGHSFFFGIVVIPVQTVIAFALALLVQRRLPGIGFFRTVYFLPVVVSFVIASAVFRLIYNSEYGMLNIVLRAFGGPRLDFLSDPGIAMYGIILLGIWHAAGYFMIIFLAGLGQIPGDYYEAADVDGASRFRKLVHVTLPLMRRTIAFVLIITTMDALRIFIPVYVVTAGGPAGATRTVVQHIYETAFHHMDLGYALAAAFVYFIIVLAISVVQLRLFRSDPED